MAVLMDSKIKSNAEEIMKRHGLSFTDAFAVTELVWNEARNAIASVVGSYGDKQWAKLSFEDRARVCTEVVKNLLDKNKIEDLINGNRKTLM